MRFLLSFQQENENKMDQVPTKVVEKEQKLQQQQQQQQLSSEKNKAKRCVEIEFVVFATSVTPPPPNLPHL